MHKLGEIIKAYKLSKEQSVSALAREIGIPQPTLFKLERDGDCGLATFFAILDWIRK